jgi:hypothetical protein
LSSTSRFAEKVIERPAAARFYAVHAYAVADKPIRRYHISQNRTDANPELQLKGNAAVTFRSGYGTAR